MFIHTTTNAISPLKETLLAAPKSFLMKESYFLMVDSEMSGRLAYSSCSLSLKRLAVSSSSFLNKSFIVDNISEVNNRGLATLGRFSTV